MNTLLTRTEAAAILLAFLSHTASIPFSHTSQGPGYPIETYSNNDVTIIWGEDDEDFEFTKFVVIRNGDKDGHCFTALQAASLQYEARVDAFEEAYEAAIEEMRCPF